MEIYVQQSGQQQGPFTVEAIKEKLRDGTISLNDLAWHEGLAEWVPVSALPGLKGVLPPPAPTQISAQKVALWNPTVAAAWSFIFTPILGAILVSKNYDALGDAVQAKKAKTWLYVGMGIVLISLVLSFAAPPARDTEIDWFGWLPLAGSVVFFIVWYTVSAQRQEKLVSERFGKDYIRKGWIVPILLAVACLIGVMLLDVSVTGMKRQTGRISMNSPRTVGRAQVEAGSKVSPSNPLENLVSGMKRGGQGPDDQTVRISLTMVVLQLPAIQLVALQAQGSGGNPEEVEDWVVSYMKNAEIIRGDVLVAQQHPQIPAGTKVYPIKVRYQQTQFRAPSVVVGQVEQKTLFYKDPYDEWQVILED